MIHHLILIFKPALSLPTGTNDPVLKHLLQLSGYILFLINYERESQVWDNKLIINNNYNKESLQ